MRLWLVGWQSDHNHEVCGMTGCRQRTASLTCLIHGAIVVRVILDLFLFAGLEPNHGALDEQDLGVAFVQEACVVVPFAAFDEHAEDVDAVLGGHRVLFLDDFEVKVELVNSYLALPSVILQRSRKETLGEKELVDPVKGRDAVVYPVLEEFKSLFQVCNVAS